MVKLNVKAVKDKVTIQKVYGINIDFDKTYEKLCREGYHPIHYSAGRKQQEEAGNLVFCLKSGIKVNISPKNSLFNKLTWVKNLNGFDEPDITEEEIHKITVTWNNLDNPEIKEKEMLHELMNLLKPFEGEKLFVVNLRTIKNIVEKENDYDFVNGYTAVLNNFF